MTAAVALAAAGQAVAQPIPPAPPPPPPLPPPPAGPTLPLLGPLGPNGLAVLAQTGQPAAGSFGIPSVPGLDPTTVLGQNAIPSAPGAGPGTPPNLNIFNNAYGIPQYLVPSAPGEGVIFDVPAGSENADVSRREWFGRWIDMYRAGQLEGGMLGQRPQEQLGQPLPGTAPPPGVNLPPGPEQFYVPPDAAPAAPLPPD
ncbi:hypothetical protein [Mycobacterium sp. 236(2023)]|uniref:hypothetical protein n=1 Tax=Mycobacterium sp. 236(2023) TaxID=3038163 RepID=UPI0024156990|nr:hypothetical protein [Mycobacterium sp. 236(2023)]MDG4665677.1 hypothetical protein [Mycobacterium sp. 236(2023)]